MRTGSVYWIRGKNIFNWVHKQLINQSECTENVIMSQSNHRCIWRRISGCIGRIFFVKFQNPRDSQYLSCATWSNYFVLPGHLSHSFRTFFAPNSMGASDYRPISWWLYRPVAVYILLAESGIKTVFREGHREIWRRSFEYAFALHTTPRR